MKKAVDKVAIDGGYDYIIDASVGLLYFKPKFDLTLLGDTRIDKDWVMKLIDSARKNNYVSAEDMKQCNSIWRKYEG